MYENLSHFSNIKLHYNPTNVKPVQLAVSTLHRVYKKKCPESKIESIFCKIVDCNSNQRLILDFRCASKSLLFSYVEFCKQGEFKMLNFQVTCAKIFQPKNEFFWRYGVINL